MQKFLQIKYFLYFITQNINSTLNELLIKIIISKNMFNEYQLWEVHKDNPYLCECLAKEVTPQRQPRSSEILLPLTKVSYQIDILNGLSEVTLIQVYQNFTQKFLEVSYRFPVAPNICLHKFTATFTKKRMQGRVKEQEQAKKEYTQAVKSGKKAAYGELSSESKDIMTIQIGNIEPRQKVTIEISYIEQLKISMNTFYQFSLPVKYNPRYLNRIPQNAFLGAFKSQIQFDGKPFSWDFKIQLRSARKLLSYTSSSHNLKLIQSNDSQTSIKMTLTQPTKLDKDFVLTFTTKQFELPSYTLGRTDAGSSVMVSFIPKFCNLSIQDAVAQAMKQETYQTQMDAARGQYVFLLDRSGSMEGGRIQKAKKALILFLKSLPIHSHFNVISFGSDSQKMFSPSPPNSTEMIKTAISRVQSMNADLGGTEILTPLRQILSSPIIPGHPKQIFLLTDGQVCNTQQIIEMIKKNIKYSRVHTIGIGDGASARLIKQCAQQGKGHFIFIKDQENPAAKIINLLNDSLTSVISQVKLKYDKSLVQGIVPNPESMPYILKNQVANFYITFKGQLSCQTSISLSYTDSSNNLPYSSHLQISPQSPSEPYIDKMSRFLTIKALQQSQQSDITIQDCLYYVKNINIKEEIIKQSVKHQVLSKYTAFICVQQELIDGKYEEIKDKGQMKVSINKDKDIKYTVQGDVCDLLGQNVCYQLLDYDVQYQSQQQQPSFIYSIYDMKSSFNQNQRLQQKPQQNAYIYSPSGIKAPPLPPLPSQQAMDLLGCPQPQSVVQPPPVMPGSIYQGSFSQPQQSQLPPGSLPPTPPPLPGCLPPPGSLQRAGSPPPSGMPGALSDYSVPSKPEKYYTKFGMRAPPPPPPLPSLPLPSPPPSRKDLLQDIRQPNPMSRLRKAEWHEAKQKQKTGLNQKSLIHQLKSKIATRNKALHREQKQEQEQKPDSMDIFDNKMPARGIQQGQAVNRTYTDLFSDSTPSEFASSNNSKYSVSDNKAPKPTKAITQKKKANLFDDSDDDDDLFFSTKKSRSGAQKNILKKPINLLEECAYSTPSVEPTRPIFEGYKQKIHDIDSLVAEQSFQGFWTNVQLIALLYGPQLRKQVEQSPNLIVVVTFLVMKWIEKSHQKAQYLLILKKALSWLKKQKSYPDVQATYQQRIK